MKIRFRLGGPRLSMEEIKSWEPNFADPFSLPQRTSAIDLPARGSLPRWQTGFLFEYDIFPAYVLRSRPEWKQQGREMREGDVIAIAAFLPPVGFGLCMEFGVRIRSMIREERKLGFSYETLAGHPERGVSEFYFEERKQGIRFVIHTLSEPAHWATRLVGPILSRPYQAWCTQRALHHVRKRFQEQNPVS